jgi:hypothetical protein
VDLDRVGAARLTGFLGPDAALSSTRGSRLHPALVDVPSVQPVSSLATRLRGRRSGTIHLISQLYATAVTVKDGAYKTYKSIYLWWQPTVTTNLTPVWDSLRIPPSN